MLTPLPVRLLILAMLLAPFLPLAVVSALGLVFRKRVRGKK